MGRYYELKLAPDTNDTLLVTAPRFPEVSTFGDTEDEALAHGLLAIEEAIAARMADGEDVPLPGERRRRKVCVELPLMPFLKAALYMICRRKGLSRAELARRMEIKHREQVDRLFRLDHNSRLDRIESAFKAVDVSLDIDLPLPDAA